MSITAIVDTMGKCLGATVGVETAARTRRSWAADEKRRIVEETLLPGASVAAVAQRHDINANLLFSWRRQAHVGSRAGGAVVPAPAEPAEFVPIGVFDHAADEGPAMVTINTPADASRAVRSRSAGRVATLDERAGVIEIDLPAGARVRVDAFVNERALSRVLRALKALT